MPHNIYIAYGSESGNAKALASTLFEKISATDVVNASAHDVVQLLELNAVALKDLTQQDTLLIITSSFGDGEPPGNAIEFHESLLEIAQVNCHYAVFGLGDVSYPKFCGFSLEINDLLTKKGAKALAKRVDADNHYQPFFETWTQAVLVYVSGKPDELKQLSLQVKSYGENKGYTAAIEKTQRINTGAFPVYDIVINIAGSGINYQAGDLLYLLAPANQNTLLRIAAFYGQLADPEKQQLATKELRLLSKPLLRALAKKTKNPQLKQLTKASASAQLADYIYGRDVADLLQDFCTPDSVTIHELLDILSAQLPRAYSIASHGMAAAGTSPDSVRLCVREVSYQQNGNTYHGTGSHFLASAQKGDAVTVFMRDNPHFHLPNNPEVPMIMIGAGTGIAPYLGFLESEHQGQMYLFFGERHAEHDFLYADELQQYLDTGKLTALYTAFSRDQAEKVYVQQRLQEQGEHMWALLAQQAEIYVCGSKANLGKSIDNTLCDIAKNHGGLSDEAAKQWLHELVSTQRYHQDLY